MKLTRLIIPVFILFFCSQAFAEDYIVCESERDSYRLCPARTGRGMDVQLVNKYSKSSCVEGRSWGVTNRGIWVDSGCRARFRISRYDYGSGGYVGGHREYYGGRNDYYGGRGDYYNDRYDDDRYHGDRRREEIRRDKREIREERRRLREERRRLQLEKQQLQVQKYEEKNQCPTGARYGRCSKSERARGCKDWKENGVPCKSGG